MKNNSVTIRGKGERNTRPDTLGELIEGPTIWLCIQDFESYITTPLLKSQLDNHTMVLILNGGQVLHIAD